MCPDEDYNTAAKNICSEDFNALAFLELNNIVNVSTSQPTESPKN